MTCTEISKSTPLYLSGELDEAAAAQFADHLKSCADCRLYVERDTEIDRLIRESMVNNGNDGIDTSSADGRVRAGMRAHRQRSRRWLMAGAGMAAVLAMTVLIRIRITPMDFLSAAANDHYVELVEKQPRRWTADPAALARLATRAGLADGVATAFVPPGYHLAQGRLCLLSGHLFLHLVYSGASGDFSLFLRQVDGGRSTPVKTARRNREHVAGFNHNELHAILVTEQGGGAAEQLARSAEAIL